MITNQLNNKTDRQLVDDFLDMRDEQSFREIYRRYTPALYLLALRMLGGAEADAQDAVQDMWIRACQKLSGFRWESALKTWLSGILINRIREFSRQNVNRNKEELTEIIPSPITRNSNDVIDLEKIIRNLPEGYRHILILHDVEGYTHEEIARLLEINAGTSKSQLFHARQSVRASLQPERVEKWKTNLKN